MDLLQTVLALFASPVQQHAPSPPVQDVLDRIVAAQPRRRSALADAALHEEQQVAHAQAQHLPPTDPGPPAPCGPLANPRTVQPCPVPNAPRHHPRSSTDTAEACSIDAAGSDNVLGAQAPAEAEHAARDDSQNHHHDSNHPSSNTTQATGSHTSSKAQPQQVNTCSAHQQMPQLTSHPVDCIPASPNAGAQLHRAASHQLAAQSQAASPSPPSPSPSPAPRSTPKKALASPSPPSPSPSPIARSTPKKAPAAAATAATAPARARPAAKPKRKPKNAEEFLRQQMSGIRRQKAQASSSRATTAGAAREGRKPAVAAEARQRQQQQQQKQAAAHGLPQGLQQLNSPPSVRMGQANKHGPDQHAPGDGPHEQRAAGQVEKKKRGPEDADAHAGCLTKKRGRRSKQQRELAGLEVHTGLTTSSGSSSSSSSSNGERDDGVEVGGGWGTGTDSIVAEDTAVPAQHAWGGGCSAPQSRGAQAAQQRGKQQQQQQQQQGELAKHQRLQQHQQRQQQQQQQQQQRHQEQQQQQNQQQKQKEEQQQQQQQEQQQRQRQEEQQKHQEQQQQQQDEATDEEDESGSQLGDLLHLSFGQLQQQRAQLPSAHLHPPPLLSKQQQQQQRQPLVSPAKSAPPTKPPQQAQPKAAQQHKVQQAVQKVVATAEKTQKVAAAEQAEGAATGTHAAVTARSIDVPGHEVQGHHAKQQASQQGVPPQSAPAKGVATGKGGVPYAPANRSQGDDSHLHVHAPIGLGIQGPTPADLAASHQEAMKLREQQAEALERERLGLNMKPITSQPAPSTKPQVQARRAHLQQQQQLSQQSHSLASMQTSFPPHQTPAISTPQLQPQLQQQQQQHPRAPTPEQQQQQQQQQQQPQKQQPPVPPTQQQQQQQQPRLTELQKFRHLQQSGPERFGLLLKAGFKSHQPPRKGGRGPGGAQGGAPGGVQRGQSGGAQGGQPGGVQGLAGKGGQAAAGKGPAGKGPGPGPTGIVSDPRLLRTLERYHPRTHDACTDAEGLKAANLAWAEAMRDGADELDAALPSVPPSESEHAAAAAPAAAAPAAATPPASAAAAPAAALPSSAAAPKATAPSAADAALATAPVTAAAAAPAAAASTAVARTTAAPSSAAATPAAATPSSAAAGICAQSAKTHAPDAAAAGPDEGGGAVNRDEDDDEADAMEHAGSRFEGGESESEGSEEGEGAARGRSSRRRGKSGSGNDPPRPPHKRVLSLGKGPPGHSLGPNATVVEVGLYADIKAHIKEGKKRSKQAYQFAQEHPDLAPPPKKRRPTYEVQQKAVCRYWLFGTCKNAGCTFKHDGQPVPKRLIPCDFHARGACKSGTSCSFSHSLVTPQPCKQLILEGSCPRNGHCSFGHDFSPEDSQLLFEFFSFSEERQQRAMAARAAAVHDAPVPVMQPPPINNACFPSQGDAYIPPLQVGGEAEVEEI